MLYSQLTPEQQGKVRQLYQDNELVMSNLHRIRVQIGKSGIVQSVTTPWIQPTKD